MTPEPLVQFMIPGAPKPGGSKRAFPYQKKEGGLGVRVADMSGQAGKDWRSVCVLYAHKEMGDRPPFVYPLAVEVLFRMPRPKHHFDKTGKVRFRCEILPCTKIPDLGKLSRALMDALTGIVWQDDSLIVTEIAHKVYDTSPGAFVTVRYADPFWKMKQL